LRDVLNETKPSIEMIEKYFSLAKKTKSPVIYSESIHRQLSKAETKQKYTSLQEAIQKTNTTIILPPLPSPTLLPTPAEVPENDDSPKLDPQWKTAFDFGFDKPLDEITPDKHPFPLSLKDAPMFHVLHYIHELPLSVSLQVKELTTMICAA
jgi:hypothetical protein